MSTWGIFAITISIVLGIGLAVLYSTLRALREKRLLAKMVYTDAVIVDVRSPAEFHLGHYHDAINIPHTEIIERASEIGDVSTPVVLYCTGGARSKIALEQLKAIGFHKVINGLSMRNLP